MRPSFFQDPIEFLVNRKYPFAYLLPLDAQKKPNPEEYKKRQENIVLYRQELKRKPEEEINKLYELEIRRYQDEVQQKSEKEELEYFFNQPSANADFKLWGKAACWTLEEAIALCFGKNPALVSWEKIKSFTNSSFVKQYDDLRFLVLRAKAAGLLRDPIIPSFFMDWARRNKIDYPQELEEEVIANGDKNTDWKKRYDYVFKLYNNQKELLENYKNLYDGAIDSRQKLYEKMELKYVEHINFLERHISSQGQDLVEIDNEKQKLSAQLKAHEKELSNLSKKEVPLHTREKETLLKIIAAMSVDAYGYDPMQRKNNNLPDLRNALNQIGQSLDDDTIRDKLKQASDFIPSNYYHEKKH